MAFEPIFAGLEMWIDVNGMKKATGLRTHLLAGTSVPYPVADEIEFLFGEMLESAFTVVPGFGDRQHAGPIDLGATNDKQEHKVSLIVDRQWKLPGDTAKLAVGAKTYFGWEKESPPPGGSTETTYSMGHFAWSEAEGKLPLKAPIMLTFGAELEIGASWQCDPHALPGEGAHRRLGGTPTMDALGTRARELHFEMEFQIHMGLGIDVGAFSGSGAFTYDLTIENGAVKNGVVVVVQADSVSGGSSASRSRANSRASGTMHHPTPTHPIATRATSAGLSR